MLELAKNSKPVVHYKKSRSFNTPLSQDKINQIERWHAQGLWDYQIAKRMGICKTTVLKYRKQLGLEDNHIRGVHKESPDGNLILSTRDLKEINYTDLCRDVLGDRVVFDVKERGQVVHFLDGERRPITEIIDEANRLRTAYGMKPIGRKNGSYV